MKLRYTALFLALALAACGQTPATTSTEPVASGAIADRNEEHGPGKDAQVIEYDAAAVLVTLDLMRGHLVSSLENARIDDFTSAQQHAVHPLAEHYEQIKAEVQQGDAALDAQLEAAFKKYQQQLADKADIAAIEGSKAEVDGLLDKIEGVLVPNHTDVHSRAISGVIETAAAEYAESIKDGVFVAPIEYQDAYGFTRIAETEFAEIKADLAPDAAQTTQAAIDTLKAAMPEIKPPQAVVKPADEVVAAATGVGDKLGRSQSAGSNAAALEAGLNRLANDVLGQIDAAIDGNDVAAARAAWEAFDGGWGAIEDGVRERSKDSYGAIEDAMNAVEDAVVRTETPTAADVKARTGALRAEIDKFVQTLK